MRPFLQDRDTVVLTPVRDRSIHWGDIVLACTATYGIVLHRVVFRKGEKLWLMGDAHSRQKEIVTEEDILAVVTAAYRKGKELKSGSFRQRCTVVIWFLMLPVRGYLIRIVDMLNRKNRER